MGAFICKQPNGKYCRFSTVVDCITDYNMTEEDYINLCVERAIEEAKRDAKVTLEKYLRPYSMLDECFAPNNMTEEEFEKIKKEMEDPNGVYTQT